jgi:carboxyl-terminal processing protease
MNAARVGVVVWMMGYLAACGGGGGGGDDGTPSSPSGNDYTPGVYLPSSTFANRCVAPRSGTNPATGRPFPDVRGTRTDENNFLRSWTNELYLWYREVPDLDPRNYETLDYFDLLKTTATTPSGAPKDRFHFTYDSYEWYQLSQAGVVFGYGAQWMVLNGTPPRRILVAYTDPDTPAADAGLSRGDEVIYIDGVDVVYGGARADVEAIVEGLYPTVQRAHTFIMRKRTGETYSVTLTPDETESVPVQNVSVIDPDTDPVGYILFNDHFATAESLLVAAFATLRDAGVNDLVLDLRYNGGGYLAIASQLAYMIAGPALTDGQVFERMVFNDKHTTTNPVTGEPLEPTPFYSTTLGFSHPRVGEPLPTLNLDRVYVLTSNSTCSASEAIINGLRGVGVEVYQIGTRTCGKPYGYYARDNCGTTYFSIQFQGKNAKDFGDYGDGFVPSNAARTGDVAVPGCEVGDDFRYDLGDPREARLAAALSFRASGHLQCPARNSSPLYKPGEPSAPRDGELIRSPLREMRILQDM